MERRAIITVTADAENQGGRERRDVAKSSKISNVETTWEFHSLRAKRRPRVDIYAVIILLGASSGLAARPSAG